MGKHTRWIPPEHAQPASVEAAMLLRPTSTICRNGDAGDDFLSYTQVQLRIRALMSHQIRPLPKPHHVLERKGARIGCWHILFYSHQEGDRVVWLVRCSCGRHDLKTVGVMKKKGGDRCSSCAKMERLRRRL